MASATFAWALNLAALPAASGPLPDFTALAWALWYAPEYKRDFSEDLYSFFAAGRFFMLAFAI